VTDFRRIEPDAGDTIEPWFGLGKRFECRFLAQMAQEAEDQLGCQAMSGLRFRHSREQSLDRGAEGDTAIGVRLGIEEDFGMDYAVRRGAIEIGEGEIAEIGFGAEHVGAGIIDVEKVLQV
jgi:hypothetical protein